MTTGLQGVDRMVRELKVRVETEARQNPQVGTSTNDPSFALLLPQLTNLQQEVERLRGQQIVTEAHIAAPQRDLERLQTEFNRLADSHQRLLAEATDFRYKLGAMEHPTEALRQSLKTELATQMTEEVKKWLRLQIQEGKKEILEEFQKTAKAHTPQPSSVSDSVGIPTPSPVQPTPIFTPLQQPIVNPLNVVQSDPASFSRSAFVSRPQESQMTQQTLPPPTSSQHRQYPNFTGSTDPPHFSNNYAAYPPTAVRGGTPLCKIAFAI